MVYCIWTHKRSYSNAKLYERMNKNCIISVLSTMTCHIMGLNKVLWMTRHCKIFGVYTETIATHWSLIQWPLFFCSFKSNNRLNFFWLVVAVVVVVRWFVHCCTELQHGMFYIVHIIICIVWMCVCVCLCDTVFWFVRQATNGFSNYRNDLWSKQDFFLCEKIYR